MATDKLPMLQEGYDKLFSELKALREERPKVVDAIEEVLQQHVFRRDGRVGFQFEQEMPVRLLQAQQRIFAAAQKWLAADETKLNSGGADAVRAALGPTLFLPIDVPHGEKPPRG